MKRMAAPQRIPRISRSVDETLAIAADLAATLRGGECLALHGPLGAGKTQFVRGLVQALGASPRIVSSPTYVLLHIYDTPRFPVFHLDAYRTATPEDFESIGFTELLTQGGVVVVEWPEKIQPLLPPSTLHIHLTPLDETTREITLPT